jgi:HSP20 family molecular chaperone IbpA
VTATETEKGRAIMATQEIEKREKQELQEKEQTRPGRYFVPDVDIYEDEEALWLRADMAGVDQNHVTVELRNDALTIHGQVLPDDYQGLTPVYTEYNVGNYLRRFTLVDAANFDDEKISARMANGVLELKLPKAARAKNRRIPIATN